MLSPLVGGQLGLALAFQNLSYRLKYSVNGLLGMLFVVSSACVGASVFLGLGFDVA